MAVDMLVTPGKKKDSQDKATMAKISPIFEVDHMQSLQPLLVTNSAKRLLNT